MEDAGRGYIREYGLIKSPGGMFLSLVNNVAMCTYPLLPQGNYIEAELMGVQETSLKYFPASMLPVDPAARFSDLFLTRSKWKVEDISPFLSDIAVNSKERDKLLLKYCRAVTDSHGTRYTARAQYNG
jgi:sister chromatid cohesion protein DCC1